MPEHRMEIAPWVAGWRKRRPKLVVLLRLDAEEEEQLARAVSAEDWDVKRQGVDHQRAEIEAASRWRWEEIGGRFVRRYD